MPPSAQRFRSLLTPTAFALAMLLLAGCGPNLIDRIRAPYWGFCGTVVIILDIIALFDLFTNDARSTGNKVLWILLIIFMPVLGCILYYLIGRE